MRSRIPLVLVFAGLLLSPSAHAAGSTRPISVADGVSAPDPFDNDSRPGALSSDGRYAAFVSRADGFADGGNPNVENVFLRDAQTGSTTLVSRSDGDDGRAANADSSDPKVAVTPDGHVLVLFVTKATNIDDHLTGPISESEALNQVWLRDVTAGTTTLVSRAGRDGAPADQSATQPSIDVTAAGPVVAFQTNAQNLVPGTSSGVFLRTLDAGANELVSCRNRNCATGEGTQAFGPSVRVVPAKAGTLCLPADHPGGCVLVAFTTDDGTITGKSDFNDQIIVTVASAPAQPGGAAGPIGGFTVASVKAGGANGGGNSTEPAWDADGNALAFVSRARDLATDGLPAFARGLYVRHFDTGTTEFASKSGTTPSSDVGGTAIGGSAQHLRVVFDATGSFGDARHQVWVRDLATSTTTLLNRAAGPDGAPGDDDALFAATLSEDGSTALFGTKATNVGEHPGDRFTHVYARGLDAPGEPVSLVSRPSGTGPLPIPGDTSFLPGPGAVSADGRYVVFGSLERLAPDAQAGITSVYLRDGLSGHTAVVSRADGADGAVATTGSDAGGISADGRRILFSTSAANVLPAGVQGEQAFVRDTATGTTTLVSRADGPDGRPSAGASGNSISADGNSVLFATRSALDPAADDGQAHLYVRNLATGTTTLVDRDSGVNGTVATESSEAGAGSLDADGSRVTWESAAAIAGAPADRNDHIFLRDLPSHVTTLVSRADGPDGAPADNSSFEAAIDASGRHVVFASEGRNLGATFDGLQVFARDVDAGRTETIGLPGGDAAPFPDASVPSIDASGERVTFSASTGTEQGVYLRDRTTQTTELVSRADGPDGAPAFALFDSDSAISPDGNCVAFDGSFTGLGDGLSSADFSSVHLRTLGSDCPSRPAVPAPPVHPPGPTGPGPDRGSPPPANSKLSRLSVSPSRFWTAGKRRGTTVRYTLSKRARVVVRIDLVRGHRVKRIGIVTLNGRTGANRWKFTGKINGKALRRGSYRLTAKPASGAGHSARFKVISAPKRR